MIQFADILYGSIALPDWILPFLRLPEFVRLRGVRLSNVDSFQFKDFSGPSRWEHCVAVAWLAFLCAERKGMSERDKVHLALAALLHDVATPPFAHTAEYVLEGYDHEIQSQLLLSARQSSDFSPDLPVFASQLPRFHTACKNLERHAGVRIDPELVAQMVVGEGDFGYLVHGSVDLDNADNVTRSCLYLGLPIDPTVPPRLAEWLAEQRYVPTDLERATNPAVQEWLTYRRELYSRFFDSTDEELGRQAFLQHLMRRAIREGMPRRTLIWNTDERLLVDMERLVLNSSLLEGNSVCELVHRYRLLEAPHKIAHVHIESEEMLRTLRLPQVVAWVESQLQTDTLEPFVMVVSARHGRSGKSSSLFGPSLGALLVFKLGGPPKHIQLPSVLVNGHADRLKPIPQAELSRRLASCLDGWIVTRPWSVTTTARVENVTDNLNSLGNWSFRLSRNDSLHPYPGTFVHAIPAGLITSLGVQGELVVDPFGGTGQTAVEAVKRSCNVVTADVNSIACLAAKARLTYIDASSRQRLMRISAQELRNAVSTDIQDFPVRRRWFNDKTFGELRRIYGFITSRRIPELQQFLLASLSAIIPSCTGRKGKEHGYFADNTPLEKGTEAPPYENAVGHFLDRIQRNVRGIESLYAQFERDGKHPEAELRRANVIRADVTTAAVKDYGIESGSVAAIITSPPYLCMADYCLGQRLSYQMLMRERLEDDFEREIGARRARFNPTEALQGYLHGLAQFAQLSAGMLRSGGFLATVLGAPVAKRFAGEDLIQQYDGILAQAGFRALWSTWRPISWHRNHGYARLKTERISVHVFR